MKIQKYGAIDIGSNAVRLLIATVIEREGKDTVFKKTSLVRVPIRLGEDVFLNQNVSDINIKRLTDTINAFKLLMETHRVINFRACATSAMREAKNGMEVAKKIKKNTGVTIQIIDGEDEATIISSTDIRDLIMADKTFLYVDVGGGSTEFTIFSNGKTIVSKSFKLGTVRLINDMVDDTMWEEVEHWIKNQTKHYTKIALIGSGGNINSIFKQSGKGQGKSLSYLYLNSYYEYIQNYSFEDRMVELDMNPDRADVIIPATRIYLSAMKWSRARKIYIPKIGLSDGIIKGLYKEEQAKNLEVNH
ncbi:MAG: exopolyphosphatase [Flavobacteriaceae bacterium CG_4_8_14_3_um_filter_34_10]|nr:exopolyphosphatase [Flavobacteriia bacterium]OIP52546.1 MAG: exopolyphosphatase [Flavobacteriaceae bacterium CG2_30_34_30]PIQ18050.1 MAG: exopolyphosphatase [Flavobacteriaceae bacterium CG18_big_fil_WC_8_21_14_2_50_34_36]PIV49804.1 MAG: exopolyphosphatase [Flavobacteriaceae bacterium CG02_land_8_20_14_3_00_34_13]PIX10575.1 MAG: exopolyphosphatase [Flavobacteriaceae bacterium CG_4_8_14_3_um_filter_34_10]PIZ08003.1 MAG: exopolyphosphatase [Flavobacteriaceae bacterium CG_4_10_14_0_8_um_filter_